MQPGAPRAQAITAPLDPVTNQPTAISYPDLLYEFRNGMWNWRREHKSLSPRVRIGARGSDGGEILMLEDSVDRIFHAHFWYSEEHGGYREVQCGSNWVILRLLLNKKGTTEDGIHWTIDMKEDEGDYPLNQDVFLDIEFEKPVPALAAWPTKDQVLSDQP
jgi:hypothetical protein